MINVEHFKDLLLKELTNLEKELVTIGRKNPDNQEDWETRGTNRPEDSADDGDVAEEIQEFETNNAVLGQLEIRLNEVKEALKKIENNSYGICEISGEEIEEDRLEANPAAKTCKKHMK